MIPLPDILILAAATWRLASLFATEEGPFGLFDRVRRLAGVRYDKQSMMYGTNTLARGMLCSWCSSIWFGEFWACLYRTWPGIAMWLALPLALSTASIVLSFFVSGD